MKNLTRSKDDRVVLGVCGGLGDYFNRDPLLFRILFILLLFANALIPFLIVYLLFALLIPEDRSKGGNEASSVWKSGKFWVLVLILTVILIIPLVFIVGFISFAVSGEISIEHEEVIEEVEIGSQSIIVGEKKSQA